LPTTTRKNNSNIGSEIESSKKAMMRKKDITLMKSSKEDGLSRTPKNTIQIDIGGKQDPRKETATVKLDLKPSRAHDQTM